LKYQGLSSVRYSTPATAKVPVPSRLIGRAYFSFGQIAFVSTTLATLGAVSNLTKAKIRPP
ncbi:MAG: hypothetical protein AAF728_09000, partial [Cyanobacteria bacterium P01_D01_bin.128]